MFQIKDPRSAGHGSPAGRREGFTDPRREHPGATAMRLCPGPEGTPATARIGAASRVLRNHAGINSQRRRGADSQSDSQSAASRLIGTRFGACPAGVPMSRDAASTTIGMRILDNNEFRDHAKITSHLAAWPRGAGNTTAKCGGDYVAPGWAEWTRPDHIRFTEYEARALRQAAPSRRITGW